MSEVDIPSDEVSLNTGAHAAPEKALGIRSCRRGLIVSGFKQVENRTWRTAVRAVSS